MSEQPTPRRRGGVKGARKGLRTAIQVGLVVAAIVLLREATTLPQRLRLAGAFTIALVAVDLVMLWRGDLDYTHFESREWSFRMNAIFGVFGAGFVIASFFV